MAISINVDPGTGMAVVACSGVLSSDDARGAATALWGHPDWRGESAVWDFRAAQFAIDSVQTRELAGFILRHQRPKPPRRIAFVTGREGDFGMARMFGAYREAPDTQFSVLRDLDAARSWAGEI